MATSGSVAAQLRQAGAPLPPEAIAPPPSDESDVDDWFMRAFFDLHTCRSLGFGAIGPIPWTAAVQYADLAGLDRQARQVFVTVISHMDRAYLADERERAKRE